MPHFLSLFLIFILTFSFIIIVIGVFTFYGKDVDMDSQYYNAEGDHIYYDRSLIEKKKFRRRFPKNSLRKFSSLFKWKC